MTALQSEKRVAVIALATVRVARTIVEQREKAFMDDRGKGATERNPQNEGEGGNTSMPGSTGAP